MKKSLKLSLTFFLATLTLATHSTHANDTTWWDDVRQYFTDTYEIMAGQWNDSAHVGAITASSPWLCREIVHHVPDGRTNSRAFNVLEIGAGPGTVTRVAAEKMNGHGRLDAVEYLPALHAMAARKFTTTNHPHVHLHLNDFCDWKTEVQEYDVIICTVPFTRLPINVVQGILTKAETLLKPGGYFTYITLIGARTFARWTKRGTEAEEYAQKLDILDNWKNEHFASEITVQVLANVTPAYVMHLQKKNET